MGSMRARRGARVRVERQRDARRIPGSVVLCLPRAVALGRALAHEGTIVPAATAPGTVLPEKRRFARVEVHEIKPWIQPDAHVSERPCIRSNEGGLDAHDAKIYRTSNAVIALVADASSQGVSARSVAGDDLDLAGIEVRRDLHNELKRARDHRCILASDNVTKHMGKLPDDSGVHRSVRAVEPRSNDLSGVDRAPGEFGKRGVPRIGHRRRDCVVGARGVCRADGTVRGQRRIDLVDVSCTLRVGASQNGQRSERYHPRHDRSQRPFQTHK